MTAARTRLLAVMAAALAVGVVLGVAVPRWSGPAGAVEAPAVRLVAVGDVACDPDDDPGVEECAQGLTAETAEDLDPDAVLLVGDAQYGAGTVEQFTSDGGWTGSWSRLLDRTWPAPGNHEWKTPGAAGYREVFDDRTGGRWWYSRDIGGWHVVSLTSDCKQVGGCDEGSEQHDWFLDDLAEHDGQPTVVFWHHPRWSAGRHGESNRVADLWSTAVADDDVQLVLAAHNHSYERYDPVDADGDPDAGGLPSFVVGTGGVSHYCDQTEGGPEPEVFDCTSYGVLSLELEADAWSWDFVASTGELEDSGRRPLR